MARFFPLTRVSLATMFVLTMVVFAFAAANADPAPAYITYQGHLVAVDYD